MRITAGLFVGHPRGKLDAVRCQQVFQIGVVRFLALLLFPIDNNLFSHLLERERAGGFSIRELNRVPAKGGTQRSLPAFLNRQFG